MKKMMTNIIKQVSAALIAMQAFMVSAFASGLDVENTKSGLFTMETLRLIPYICVALTDIAVVLIIIMSDKLQRNEPVSVKLRTVGIGAAVLVIMFICYKLGG